MRTISGPYVGSRPIDVGDAGHGALKHVDAADAKDAEQISYANFSSRAGRDLLVRKIGRGYMFRMVYPRCGWVGPAYLPPDYVEIAKAWLKLRRRGLL